MPLKVKPKLSSIAVGKRTPMTSTIENGSGREDPDGVDADLEDLELDDAAELDDLLLVVAVAVGPDLALEVAAAVDRARLDAQPDRVGPARARPSIGNIAPAFGSARRARW